MHLTIQFAEVNDAEAIAELSNQLGYEADSKKIEKRLYEILDDRKNCVFIAEKNNEIIGWIHTFYTLRVESDPFVEIGGLVVDQNHQKQGVGKILVEHAIGWAESIKCSKIRVRCNTKRAESHVFYERIGFRLNKEQKVFDKRL
jgi:GNAT superfamily N-acetyltransferase